MIITRSSSILLIDKFLVIIVFLSSCKFRSLKVLAALNPGPGRVGQGQHDGLIDEDWAASASGFQKISYYQKSDFFFFLFPIYLLFIYSLYRSIFIDLFILKSLFSIYVKFHLSNPHFYLSGVFFFFLSIFCRIFSFFFKVFLSQW